MKTIRLEHIHKCPHCNIAFEKYPPKDIGIDDEGKDLFGEEFFLKRCTRCNCSFRVDKDGREVIFEDDEEVLE